MGLGICGECGSTYQARMKVLGPVLECPKCGGMQHVTPQILDQIIDKDLKCPKHRVKLLLKTGSRGPFMTCSLFPKCTYTTSVVILKIFAK